MRFLRHLLLLPLLPLVAAFPATAAKWEPISADLVAIDDCPVDPGCPAAVLRYEVLLDNGGLHTRLTHHVILKVFTSEGLGAATVKVPWVVGDWNISALRARSVAADGSVAELDPQSVREETVVKVRGYWRKQLSFEIPGAAAGSYLEYYYEANYDYQIGYYAWYLQGDWPVVQASIAIVPGRTGFAPRPQELDGARVTRDTDDKGRARYNMHNIRALKDEPMMPPDNAVRGRMILYPSEPWWSIASVGTDGYEEVQKYFKRSSKAKKLARQIAAEASGPADIVEKIYVWLQDNIENSGYEESEEGEVSSDDRNLYVDDVVTQGSGTGQDIVRLFVFLVRQAGIEAEVAWVASREDEFFNPETFLPNDFTGEIGAVQLGNEWRFYDPGTRYCPPGMVRWDREGVDVNALVTRKGGGFLRQVPWSRADDNLLQRETVLSLEEDGSVRADVSVEAHGLAGVELRNGLDHMTDSDRVGWYEERLEKAFPGVEMETVELLNLSRWREPLQVRLTFHAKQWADGAGSRLLLPAAPYQASLGNPLTAAERQNPVYFRRTSHVHDTVTIHLPEGYEVESLPGGRTKDVRAVRYEAAFAQEADTIRLERDMKIDVLLVEADLYDVIQDVYKSAARSDGAQIVLRRTAAAAEAGR